MGTLFSALDIGRAGLGVAQVQLDVTGHNIANVNKVGFSRQRVELTTRLPNVKSYGSLGRGPAIEGVVRIRDQFLDEVYRQQVPGLGNTALQAGYFARMEDIFNEPGDAGFSDSLNAFFDSMNDFANNVESLPVRVATLAQADAVAASFRDVNQRLVSLRTNANEEVRNLAPQINSLGDRIAKLNGSISKAEVNGRTANDLRDDRDVLLDQLARIVNIRTNERDDGQIDVFLGGDTFVTAKTVREIEAVPSATINPDVPGLLQVQYVGTGLPVHVTNGELFGALQMRDVEVPKLLNEIDTLAARFIEGINSIHSQGNGLSPISGTLRSTNLVDDPFIELTGQDLPFPIQDGSFDVVIYNSAGNIVQTITLPIRATGPASLQTDLTSLELNFTAIPNLTGSQTPEGELTITAAPGFSFSFANDTSGVLTALGLNGLFTGSDAGSIDVSAHLEDHPEWLSSAFSTDALDTGDNTAALAMAAVRDAKIFTGNTQTVNDFFEATIAGLGINSAANLDRLDVEEAFVQDFDLRRQEVFGVNLDEEVTMLIQFQRAFEAAARLITVTDNMLGTLVNLIR